jgi:hypothetical protein
VSFCSQRDRTLCDGRDIVWNELPGVVVPKSFRAEVGQLAFAPQVKVDSRQCPLAMKTTCAALAALALLCVATATQPSCNSERVTCEVCPKGADSNVSLPLWETTDLRFPLVSTPSPLGPCVALAETALAKQYLSLMCQALHGVLLKNSRPGNTARLCCPFSALFRKFAVFPEELLPLYRYRACFHPVHVKSLAVYRTAAAPRL